MEIKAILLLTCFLLQLPASAEEDYKDTVSKNFGKVSKELTEQEDKLIASSPQDTREALRKSLAQWREWAKSYAEAKNSGARGAGSAGFYYRLDDQAGLYKKQIEWLRQEIAREAEKGKVRADQDKGGH